mgnify:FL=1
MEMSKAMILQCFASAGKDNTIEHKKEHSTESNVECSFWYCIISIKGVFILQRQSFSFQGIMM